MSAGADPVRAAINLLYREEGRRVRSTLIRLLGDFDLAEEALVIMVQSYDRLGLNDLRDDAQRVLAKNFPNSRFASQGLSTRERQWWQIW